MDDVDEVDGADPSLGHRPEPLVAVVGAGPVGLVTANLLACAGVPLVVYERDPVPSDQPRAVHLDDDALRTLQAAGLAQAVAAGTRPSAGMELVGPDWRVLWRFPRASGPSPAGHPPSSLVHQPELEAVLRVGLARFPHVQLRSGEEVVALHARPPAAPAGAVVESVGGGRRRRQAVRVVLGCDGAGSSVRRLAGLGTVDARFDQRWLVLDVREPPPRSLSRAASPAAAATGTVTASWAQQLCDPARPATFVPVGGPDGARCRWEFLVHPGEDVAALLRPSRLAELTAPWRGTDAPPAVERAAVYRFHALRAARWRRGPVLLLGDAAHQMPPFLGQGLCAGIRDAANLTWKLRLVLAGLAGEALLDTYEAERAPHVRAVTTRSVLLGRVVTGKGASAAAVRAGLRLARLAPARLRAPLEHPLMPGLPAGRLVPRRRAPGRRPGPRAWPVGRPFPQPVVDHDGQRLLLDDVIGLGFAAVVLGPPAAWSAVLRRPEGRWFAALGRVLVAAPAGAAAGRRCAGCRGAGDQPAWCTVEDRSGALARWFDAAHARAAIVRPDRYVYALAGDAAALATQIDGLRTTLLA